MDDFYDLRKPEQEIHGIHKGKWYVIAKQHPKAAALVNDSTFELEPVKWSEEENSIFYFDTNIDAYKASISYYTKHGKAHPDLMAITSGSDPAEKNESQHMKFI